MWSLNCSSLLTVTLDICERIYGIGDSMPWVGCVLLFPWCMEFHCLVAMSWVLIDCFRFSFVFCFLVLFSVMSLLSNYLWLVEEVLTSLCDVLIVRIEIS
jgi:hypothetical protein